MKNYYYAENNQQFGPFLIQELSSKRLKKNTLIWTDGMQDWEPADNIKELKEYLVSDPPPLPRKITIISPIRIISINKKEVLSTSPNYDLSYSRETDATGAGVLLIILIFSVRYIFANITINELSIQQANVFMIVGSILLRIMVTNWVIKIASRQNRNITSWGWFAFFLPSISLIIIGQLKKLWLIIELDETLSKKQQISVLLEKAKKLFNVERYEESIAILNKIFENDNQNFDCIKLSGMANIQIHKYHEAYIEFDKLVNNNKYLDIAYFYLGNLKSIEGERLLAISYWLKAIEYGNEDAKRKLDQFHTFTGEYLLEHAQVIRKLDCKLNGSSIYFGDGKYAGGIKKIDDNENINSLTTRINSYINGIHIELDRAFKTTHIAISYFEIADIFFDEQNGFFELQLEDKNVLTIKYNQTNDYHKGLMHLCQRFNENTGKSAAASKFWTE